MKSKKQLGIWMDHTVAYLLELANGKITTKTLESTTAFPERVPDLRLDESLMNNKEQNEISEFFKKVSAVIKDYDEVLLFGPTNAKTELFNILKDDRHFEQIKIVVKPADKMTENQQKDFVKEFFN